jgi:hypothetical protein
MKTIRLHLLLLLLLLLAIPASAARREIFVAGKDRALWTKAFDGGAWGEWQRIDVTLLSSPDAIAGPGFVEVFYVGPDRGIHHMRRTGSTWGAAENLEGELHSTPGAVRLANGDIHVFAVGSDKAMWHIASHNGQWGAWHSIGGEFATARPQAVDRGTGRLEVFAVGKDGKIWAQSFDGTNWSGWDYINEGLLLGDPAVTTLSGHNEVIALGTDRRLWHTNRGPGTRGEWATWGPWNEERFDAGHNPDVDADNGETILAIRGMDGSVRVHTNAGWTNAGGEIESDPAIVVAHSGTAPVVTIATPMMAPAPSARYRVTINGFIVHRETNDDPLERDGARDEIFLKAYAATAGSPAGAHIPAMTRVFGDVHNNPSRIRAGSARGVPGVGADGGFMTGDSFPTRTPWNRNAEPVRPQEPADGEIIDVARQGVARLPMIAWEGQLVRGRNAVVVVPAIIETDNRHESGSRDTTYLASTLARSHSAQLLAATPSNVDQLIRELAQVIRTSVRYPQGPDPGDRPIGMQLEGNQYVWKTSPIVLTYDIAEAMVARAGEFTDIRPASDGSSRSITQPLPAGVSFINWRDHSDLGGDYTLFWQIEKLR